MKPLTTTSAVITALGGDAVLAWMLSTSKSAVSNWRCWNKFPANTYLVIAAELRVRGLAASDKLWAMKRRKQKRIGDNVRLDAKSSGAV